MDERLVVIREDVVRAHTQVLSDGREVRHATDNRARMDRYHLRQPVCSGVA